MKITDDLDLPDAVRERLHRELHEDAQVAAFTWRAHFLGADVTPYCRPPIVPVPKPVLDRARRLIL